MWLLQTQVKDQGSIGGYMFSKVIFRSFGQEHFLTSSCAALLNDALALSFMSVEVLLPDAGWSWYMYYSVPHIRLTIRRTTAQFYKRRFQVSKKASAVVSWSTRVLWPQCVKWARWRSCRYGVLILKLCCSSLWCALACSCVSCSEWPTFWLTSERTKLVESRCMCCQRNPMTVILQWMWNIDCGKAHTSHLWRWW